MLFDRKSVATGMSPHPLIRCLLPSVDTARLRAKGPSVHHPPISFRTTVNIQCTAGGFYGDEFRPD
jgi:hypothetical protein